MNNCSCNSLSCGRHHHAPCQNTCGYVLSDGDNIEFLYSCEMGNDLN